MNGLAHLLLFSLLALAATLAMVRLVRGPSVPDRVVAPGSAGRHRCRDLRP
jgi:multisubunit Na+/H+ antiporter MnhF subunit